MLPYKTLVGVSTSFWIFSIPAVCLTIPSGYSYGAIMLAIISTHGFWQKPQGNFNARDKWILLAIVSGGIVSLLPLLDGFYVRRLETPLRFGLAVLTLRYLVLHQGTNHCRWMLHGVIIGSISAAALASYQVFGLGSHRANGQMNAIMFGNAAVLLGLISLASVGWFALRGRRWLAWAGLIACECGIFCSILSGSRGGWLAFPLLNYVLWHYRSLLSTRQFIAANLACIASIAFFLAIPTTGAAKRATLGINNLARYSAGDKESSVGYRLDLWRCALGSFVQSPIIGVGKVRHQENKQAWAQEGLIDPKLLEYGHAHNEYLNELSLHGLVGFAGLMAMYLIPLFLFVGRIKDVQWPQKVFPVCGAVVPLSYMIFGLTQAMFSHNSGRMIYLFFIVIFWTLSRDQGLTAGALEAPVEPTRNATG